MRNQCRPSLWALDNDNIAYQVDDFNDEWIASQRQHRHIGISLIGKIRVSTVFLGVASRVTQDPCPFETIVFCPDGASLEEERYRTFADAERGHAALVAKWRILAR